MTVVEYLKTPPGRAELARLYAKAGMTPRQGLRLAEDAAKPLKDASDDAILDAMAANPILIERPLVETDKGVRLGRPPEDGAGDSLGRCDAPESFRRRPGSSWGGFKFEGVLVNSTARNLDPGPRGERLSSDPGDMG